MFKTKYNLKQSDIDNGGQVSQVEFEERLASLGLPDYGFYLFRHTHASMLLNAGINGKNSKSERGISQFQLLWIFTQS